MPKKYAVVAITGTYQKEGQDKPRYENVGAVIEKDGKFYLKVNKIVFHDDGHVVNFFSLYEPKQQNQTRSEKTPEFNDDIPF